MWTSENGAITYPIKIVQIFCRWDIRCARCGVTHERGRESGNGEIVLGCRSSLF